MKIILFSLCCFISILATAQTTNSIRYLDANNTSTPLDSVAYLFIDCTTDDCSKIFSDLNKYQNLKGLYITNYDDKIIGKSIETLSNLESLTIEKSPKINFTKLISNLSKLTNLKDLSLKDNELIKLPSNIKSLNQLKSINISNNNNLNLEKAINQLAELNNLEEIYLPVNSITDLPNNIGKLNKLKILDISNNYLEDLPDGISEMRSLEELSIEGNLVQDVTATLTKVQNINLKYIALDDGLSANEKKRLNELFPNAEIKEVDTDEISDQPLEENIDEGSKNTITPPKEANSDTISDSKITPEKETRNINFGELNVEQQQLKIYSQAYFHYPKVFGLKRSSIYDTTMFEERFLDTNYAYTNKVQRGINSEFRYNRLSLGKVSKSKEDDILFSITPTLNRSNMEIFAFRGMSWVYVGNKNDKEFTKTFVKSKNYKWYKPSKWRYSNKWKFWNDIRIIYNSDEENFTIILKDINGFTEITAYPIYAYSSRTLDDAKKTYVKRFARYTKSLTRRKVKFERDNLKDKVRYEKSIALADKKKWESFQKNYMSEAERKLSKEDWLIYYDKVIANERKAMGNAAASINNIERSLNLDGYTKDYLWRNPEQAIDSTGILSIKSLYQDTDSNMLAVKRIIILDKDNNTYQTYEGSLGIKMIRLNIIQGVNSVFVVQLRNDDIGYVTSDEYQRIKFPKSRKYKFTLKTVNAKFSTVQMVREELNF